MADLSKFLNNGRFNSFEGTGALNYIARGTGVNSTVAQFYLPISSPTEPTSLSFSSGATFTILGGGVSNSNIPSSNISLNPLSSNKYAVIDITGLTGIVNSTDYHLYTLNTSRLTVNF